MYMISSQGLKESSFDVLDLQGGDKSPVYQIPIKKGFDNVRQPTELSPIETPVHKGESSSSQVETSISSERFETPRELLNYLDVLIVQRKLPLKTLKFDIEFAKSTDEIAKYLESYVDKSKIIPEKDLDKLFGFIGYGRSSSSGEDSVTEVKTSAQRKVEDFFRDPEVVAEVSTKVDVPQIDSKIEVSVGLLEARVGYVDLLVPYLEKVKKDKALYSKIMAELGGNSDMPLKDESKELTSAREDYIKAKKEQGIIGILDELDEVEILRKEVIKTLVVNLQIRLEKASGSWGRYLNSSLVSTSLLGEDVNDLEKIVDPAPFGGLRVSPGVVEPKVAQEQIKKEEAPEVQTIPETPNSEIKFEIVGEGQKIQEEEKNINKNGASAPVDISVAEKGPTAQNVFPSEFEGKKLEIMVGSPEVSPQISVVWDGKEIAQGSIVKGKPVVKINDKFKSGFLFADTKEENALKHAMPIIKTLRS